MKHILLMISFFFFPLQAYSGEWVAVDGGVVEVRLVEADLENALWSFLQSNSKRVFESRKSYLYQYKAITTDNLKIHASCRVDKNYEVHQEFVIVDDGGSCYFELNYHLGTGLFSDLYVNGEA